MCNRIDEPIPNSIAYGVLAGIGSYLIINVTAYALRKLTGGYLTPPTYDTSEKWKVPHGGFLPLWMYVLRYLLIAPSPRLPHVFSHRATCRK